MKATQRTSRRHRSQTGPGISLFPFLAVLICTMGALVPLLLAITRTARLQAEAAELAKATEQGTELKTQQEDVRWRIEMLKKSRDQKQTQLADARLELGHIEDHSRRLRSQLAQYQRTITDVQTAKNLDQERLRESQTELEQVKRQIVTAQQQVADASKAAAGNNRCYAVIPYEGPNQTHRRPIYLECRADAVILQPEGIELTESDFEGPQGPGNPLAATLRAAREYMLANRQFDPQGGDPYPMLLVRPEGISAYYAARAAMKSWGFDFGYELVDDDWKLAFPPPDPKLAAVARQVVASARVSQARLAAAAPRQYGGGTITTYRAANGGGFIRETVPAKDEDRGYASATPAGPVGAAAGSGGGTPAAGTAVGLRSGYPGDGRAMTGAGGAESPFDGGGPAASGVGGSDSPYVGSGPVLSGAGGGSSPYGATGDRPETGMPGGNSVASAMPPCPYPGGSASTGSSVSNPNGQSETVTQSTSGTKSRGGQLRASGTYSGSEAGSNSLANGEGAERPDGYVVGQPAREHVGIESACFIRYRIARTCAVAG